MNKMSQRSKLVLMKVLDLYVEWTRLWNERSQKTSSVKLPPVVPVGAYLPQELREELDIQVSPEHSYGDVGLNTMTRGDGAFFGRIYIFEVTSGDDGGPLRLIAWVNREGEITQLLQEFDTEVVSFWNSKEGYESPK